MRECRGRQLARQGNEDEGVRPRTAAESVEQQSLAERFPNDDDEEESWDNDEPVPTYNPEAHVQRTGAYVVPMGLTRRERRDHRERARLAASGGDAAVDGPVGSDTSFGSSAGDASAARSPPLELPPGQPFSFPPPLERSTRGGRGRGN